MIGCGCIRDSDLSGFWLAAFVHVLFIYAHTFSTFQLILNLSCFAKSCLIWNLERKGNVKPISILANFSPRQKSFLYFFYSPLFIPV